MHISRTLSISHGQLCVFDADLEAPYNDWSAKHTAQGFAWRPGSVSFATRMSGGPAEVVFDLQERAPDLNGGVACAIRVPFDVPASGIVEIGSIMSGDHIAVQPGAHDLYFLDYGAEARRFRLVLTPQLSSGPDVLRECESVRRQAEYEMTASPA